MIIKKERNIYACACVHECACVRACTCETEPAIYVHDVSTAFNPDSGRVDRASKSFQVDRCRRVLVDTIRFLGNGDHRCRLNLLASCNLVVKAEAVKAGHFNPANLV